MLSSLAVHGFGEPEPRWDRVGGLCGRINLSFDLDAFHRSHGVTYLCHASAGHAREEVGADDVHRTASEISGLYAEVCQTEGWIASTAPRKQSIGKNAGG